MSTTDAPTRASLLAALAREVRRDTLQLLQAARPAELTWAPPGTTNHLLWHAGHALWLQDALCLRLLSGRSELPAGWEGRFAMGSRPAQEGPWPGKEELLDRLSAQLTHVLARLAALPDDALDRGPPHAHPGDTRTLGYCILHGWHDEAKHQGEMYLLLKMRRLDPGPAGGFPQQGKLPARPTNNHSNDR
jgi:hypothetical protein